MKVHLLIALLLATQAGAGIVTAAQRGPAVSFTSFVDRQPTAAPPGAGWLSEFDADGQTVRITAHTKVRIDDGMGPLAGVPAGAEVVVSGIRDVETGRVIADRVRFSANELEPGEARLWRSLAAERTAQELTSGQLRIPTVGTYTLLADEDIQARVGRIGGRLIPAYQRDLPGDDPRKIPFQFHVVASRSVNAFATPNGIVVIHRGLLDLLQNDAQLAAVLAHEIVHATHEHTWRERKHQRIPRIAVGAAGVVAAVFGVSSGLDLALMVNTALISRHARALENQADRVSLYYMAQAGYEPREAPRVWEILRAHLGDRKADPLWGSYESQSRRRAQLLQELAYNHRQ